ncbi:MAG: formate dehydrogenase accessory sulfurtransferase FdhD [Caldiserica bacterium]|nr:formate dehydrogenase accessory sulfurtransferase FdhD [Caldisericota bacterium]
MMTTIGRYHRSGTAVRCQDEVTEERALTIYVNGTLAVRLASSGEPVDAAAVGHALMRSWNLRKAVLMWTGRIPARAVVQLASRSAATAQAIALAERVGVTVIAFVRAKRMNVCSHPERVVA